MIRPVIPWRLAWTLVLSAIFAAIVFVAIPLRTDMTGFLPRGHDVGSRFLLREVQSGAAGTVIMLGIEGAPHKDVPEAELARLSTGLRKTLSGDRRFVVVLNGAFDPVESEALHDVLFRHRYQLSPDNAARDFSEASLKTAFGAVLDNLDSAAGSAFGDTFLRDPTNAFVDTLHALQPDVHVRMRQGVWFAPDRPGDDPRALLLIRTRATGMDLPRQKDAQGAIREAFAVLHPGSAHLLMSGPAVFALSSATAMRHDVDTMALFSTLIVATILYWRFRSLWVLAAIGVPFLLSLGVAMIVVRLVFGSVHGIAFGFGMTMLGVSLDYPVLLIGHRDRGEGPGATLRRIGDSLRIGVATAILGLTGMMFCGLPGLAQLGTFAAAGLLTAAIVTLRIMPGLIVSADLAPVVSGPSPCLRRAETARTWRIACLIPVAAGLAAMVLHPLRLDTRLAALSSIPARRLVLDEAFRRELGVPDASLMMAVSGRDAQDVLRREEAMLPVMTRLAAQGAITGAQDAARLLPSVALQQDRARTLPDAATLKQAVTTAREDLPFRERAFDGFVDDVTASRQMPPLRPEDLRGTPLATALSSLIFERGGSWWGLVLPEGVSDPEAVAAAMAGRPSVLVLDLHREMDGLSAHYMARTLRYMAFGCLLALGVLAAGLRDVRRAGRVLGAVGAALVTLLGIFALLDVRLTLVHFIALQFVTGVSLDYALFFARPQLDDEERARTMRTLLTCNAMTALTFGLLALCQTVILRHIGMTVAPGVVLAMIFGFLLAGQRIGTGRARIS